LSISKDLHKHSLKDPLLQTALASLALVFLKLFAYVGTGSLVVLTSLFDSLTDSAISWLNSRVFQGSLSRPDEEHPYGHGGFEAFASVLQGGMMALMGVWVFIQSGRDLYVLHSDGFALPEEGIAYLWASGVLLFSAASGFGLQFYLKRVQLRKSHGDRLVVETDRAHYMGDFWMNLAAAIGLLFAWSLNDARIDRLFGALGALLLLRTGIPIIRASFQQISQEALPADKIKSIARIVYEADRRVLGIHRFRSRAAGPDLFVDFHLKLADDTPLHEAHLIGEKVSKQIRKALGRIDVVIHLDPESEPDDDLWENSAELSQSLSP
jgi:ferrous-iron efflux pump FieF